jgi:hypothetical protein
VKSEPLRAAITSYTAHRESAAWIEALVREHGLARVLDECVDVLEGNDTSEMIDVSALLRDVGIYGIVDDALVSKVRRAMPRKVLPVLRRLLRSPLAQNRMTAIYTIGKLTFSSQAKALRSAFSVYVERDPFCLASLLFELRWLGDSKGVLSRVKKVIAHRNYLIRWSALGYFKHTSVARGELRLRRQWLQALSTDSVLHIANEAKYQLAELETRAKRRVALAEPALTFDILELRFLGELARRKKTDYDLAELDQFVRSL